VDGMQEEVLGVLREIWNAHEQSAADLDETCSTKECKRMTDVGFDALAEETDGDLRTAWRTQLAREGKLNGEAGSVRDLVLRQQQLGCRARASWPRSSARAGTWPTAGSPRRCSSRSH
jgi:hypothetical protein